MLGGKLLLFREVVRVKNAGVVMVARGSCAMKDKPNAMLWLITLMRIYILVGARVSQAPIEVAFRTPSLVSCSPTFGFSVSVSQP